MVNFCFKVINAAFWASPHLKTTFFLVKSCNGAALPAELPPERPEDHAIELMPGSEPPNRPPYRVSAAQREEILAQVQELLSKGLIQPSFSPFCSPGAEERWVILYVSIIEHLTK